MTWGEVAVDHVAFPSRRMPTCLCLARVMRLPKYGISGLVKPYKRSLATSQISTRCSEFIHQSVR